MTAPQDPPTYGCSDYRQEMMLVGLCRRLCDPNLDPAERRALQAAIRELEEALYGTPSSAAQP
jgi:hypothetical protein